MFFNIMFNNNQTNESVNRVMNRAEVQGAYDRTMRQIKQESSDAFERFRHVRSEACREANQRIKELKAQITRLECEIMDAQERRAKIIEDARDNYDVAIQTAAEAKTHARMEYQMAMLIAEDAERNAR